MPADANGTVDPPKERMLFGLLAAVCGLLIAAGSMGSLIPNLQGADAQPVPLALGNVAEAHIVEIRDQRGAVLLAGEFRSRVDSLGDTEKDASLIDKTGRRVIGEVELDVPSPSRQDRRPELEVDIMGLPPRTTFNVVIDDRVVATFMTDDRGSVDMELQEGEVTPSPFGT